MIKTSPQEYKNEINMLRTRLKMKDDEIYELRRQLRGLKEELSSYERVLHTSFSSESDAESASNNSSITDEVDAFLDDLSIATIGIDPGSKLRGRKPRKGDNVHVHYTVAVETPDNIVMSSREHFDGIPFRFKCGVGQVIEGWDRAIKTFKGRERKRITIPPHLGYVEGLPPVIPKKSALICEIELLDIT
mmetsp:Transcript_2371/g.3289  ORF Transcript_2371/g.3289 Transcript_2371/m.3289 type:complete len:190 (+) Transcript_2371:1017-1586(+)